MSIHNSKITSTALVAIVFLFAVSYVNKNNTIDPIKKITSGSAIATTTTPKPLPLILDLNKNTKGSQVQNALFPIINKSYDLTTQNKDGDELSSYLINIFCSESNIKYVKVASGSGIFLSNPTETVSVILTNAHVARHLLDSKKKCVGRTGSPTNTTHTLTLRYIPHHWLNKNNKYVIGDPDQNSTGEYDFAILEATRIKPILKPETNIYTALKTDPKLKISSYEDNNFLSKTYIYSYPAQSILTKNVYNPLYQKKDLVTVSSIYASPSENIQNSLLDVVGSRNVDHGSSGGMVISQGSSNSIIGLSSILIKSDSPQVVRVVTINHVLSTIENDLKIINNAQTDSFLLIIKDMLSKKEIDLSFVQILKNIKLTSVLEQYTRDTLKNLYIIQ